MAYAYTTLGAVKAVLKLADSSQDAQVTADIATASRLVNDYCKRVFLNVSEARTFDAPASGYLDVPDLMSVTSVVQDGVSLVAGTDYELLPHTLTGEHPAYTQVLRLQNGFERRWGYTAIKAQVVSVPISRWGNYPFAAFNDGYGAYSSSAAQPSAGTIVITGTWGFGTSVPEPVIEATEIITVRLFNQRLKQYQPAGTQPGAPSPPKNAPLIDAELVGALLAPYIYLPTAEGNG